MNPQGKEEGSISKNSDEGKEKVTDVGNGEGLSSHGVADIEEAGEKNTPGRDFIVEGGTRIWRLFQKATKWFLMRTELRAIVRT